MNLLCYYANKDLQFLKTKVIQRYYFKGCQGNFCNRTCNLLTIQNPLISRYTAIVSCDINNVLSPLILSTWKFPYSLQNWILQHSPNFRERGKSMFLKMK